MRKNNVKSRWQAYPDDDQDVDSIAIKIAKGCFWGAELNTVWDEFTEDSLARKQKGNNMMDFDSVLSRFGATDFDVNSVYYKPDFEQRIRIPRVLFNRVKNKLLERLGFFCPHEALIRQKTCQGVYMIATLRVFGYGK